MFWALSRPLPEEVDGGRKTESDADGATTRLQLSVAAAGLKRMGPWRGTCGLMRGAGRWRRAVARAVDA